MTTIAVTGAQGFIGRHLCALISRSELKYVALSRQSLSAGGLTQELSGCSAVIHLAARAHVLHESASSADVEFRAANVTLTQRVAEAARSAGVRRFVFVSSAGVLGPASPADGFDDTSPPRPHDAYTRSKLEAERWLTEEFSAALDVTIVRPPLVYGPGARGNFDRLLRAVLSGWPLPVGAIDARRSMVGVRNLSDLLLRAATSPRVAGACMLVADEEMMTVGEFACAIAESAGRKPRIVAVPLQVLKLGFAAVGRRADFVRLTQPFVLRAVQARRLLSWVPPYRMRDELDWTVAEVIGVRVT